MKFTPHILPVLIAGLCLAAPATGYSKKKDNDRHDRDDDRRDRDRHDRHDRDDDRRDRDRHHHHNNDRYYYRSGYATPYRYYRPSLGISLVTRPSYSNYSPSYNYGDRLSVDVQRSLARRGYYRGPIDGDIGPGSRSAIRAYQYDRGLAVTGRIDRSLLRALGLA